MVEAENHELHWYALKVFYNKVFAVEEELTADDTECYVPVEETMVERGGQRRKVQRQLTDRAILYTRHCDDGRRRPYAIPDREMNVFMLVASSGETGLEYFGDEDRKFAEGQRVRVTDGPFRGAEGSIQRIHGDRRLLVSIRGICAVATTYIPKAFLEEIN